MRECTTSSLGDGMEHLADAGVVLLGEEEGEDRHALGLGDAARGHHLVERGAAHVQRPVERPLPSPLRRAVPALRGARRARRTDRCGAARPPLPDASAPAQETPHRTRRWSSPGRRSGAPPPPRRARGSPRPPRRRAGRRSPALDPASRAARRAGIRRRWLLVLALGVRRGHASCRRTHHRTAEHQNLEQLLELHEIPPRVDCHRMAAQHTSACRSVNTHLGPTVGRMRTSSSFPTMRVRQFVLCTALVATRAIAHSVSNEAAMGLSEDTPANPHGTNFSDQLTARFDLNDDWSIKMGGSYTHESAHDPPPGRTFRPAPHRWRRCSPGSTGT